MNDNTNAHIQSNITTNPYTERQSESTDKIPLKRIVGVLNCFTFIFSCQIMALQVLACEYSPNFYGLFEFAYLDIL